MALFKVESISWMTGRVLLPALLVKSNGRLVEEEPSKPSEDKGLRFTRSYASWQVDLVLSFYFLGYTIDTVVLCSY